MVCDVETDICGEAEEGKLEMIDFNQPENQSIFL